MDESAATNNGTVIPLLHKRDDDGNKGNNNKKKKDDYDNDNDNEKNRINDFLIEFHEDEIRRSSSSSSFLTLARSNSGCSRRSRNGTITVGGDGDVNKSNSNSNSTIGDIKINSNSNSNSNSDSPVMIKVKRMINIINNKTINVINQVTGTGINSNGFFSSNGPHHHHHHHHSNNNNHNQHRKSFLLIKVVVLAIIIVFFVILFSKQQQPTIGRKDLLLSSSSSSSLLTRNNQDTSLSSSSSSSLSLSLAAAAQHSSYVHIDVTSTSSKDGICHPCIVKYIQRIKEIGIFDNSHDDNDNDDNDNDDKHIEGENNATTANATTMTTNANTNETTSTKKKRKIIPSTVAMGNETVLKAWENMLCQPLSSNKLLSTRPFIIGIGPGTTATRSFALAVNLLRRSVLHFKVYLHRLGVRIWTWDVTNIKYHVDELSNALYSDEYDDWLSIVDRIDFASTFHNVDAIFDFPFPFYALDFLRAFPNAKILMTHRDPSVWYRRRIEFCSVQKTWKGKKLCSMPFLLRPWKISLTDKGFTEQKSIETFLATEEVLKCLVGPDRYLQVDAWDPPRSDEEGSWMPELSNFIDVPVPPISESNCTIPKQTTHNLECNVQDHQCKSCFHYMNKHRDEYLPKE